MDYADWVRRMLNYFAAPRRRGPGEEERAVRAVVGPPLDESALDHLGRSLDCGLPPPLRRFLAFGTSSIAFLPAEEEDADEVFCPAAQLAHWRAEAREYARRSWLREADWPLDRAYWRHALPLLQYPDGDGPALWVHDPEHADPAVVYLRHDAESFLLSRTLDDFLAQWERLGYASVHQLIEYRSPTTGFLDFRVPTATALRQALGLEG